MIPDQPYQMNSERTGSKNVHLLEHDAVEPPTKSMKTPRPDHEELRQRLADYENVVNFTPPSPKDLSSQDDTPSQNVRRINSRFLGIQVGSQRASPSFSQESSMSLSIVTEGGMTTCGDGGQDLERLFLRDNPDKIPYRNFATANSVVESVRKALRADETKLQSATNSKPFFIPCTHLYGILSQETIGLLLKEIYPNEDLGTMTKETLAPLLPGPPSFRRTIAVLILINKQEYLRWFFEQDINDSELPFEFAQMRDLNSEYAKLGWETEDFRDFCRIRLEVSPVFFAVSKFGKKEKIVHYQCHSGEVMPFTKHIWTASGGFGEVFLYHLHNDQQNLHRYTEDGPSRAVAVKRLYRADKSKEFRGEFDMLNRLSHLKTSHIAKLLGAYETPSGPGTFDYFLMFECADDTLLAIWEKEPKDWRPDASSATIARWVATQAYGLTNALSKLHNFKVHMSEDDTSLKTHGIHGDLKPDNILHYKNWKNVNEALGILQITDFGLSSFHETQSAEGLLLLRGTNAYRPPEAAILSPISASFDTWSLGCLFLEFLTWLVQGPESLKSFKDKRLKSPGFAGSHPCFWEANEVNGCTIVSLSSIVQDWVTSLYEDSNSSPFVRDFCELIVNSMLVIEELQVGKKDKKGKYSPRTRSRRASETKRIMTGELAKELKVFTTKGEDYFTPTPANVNAHHNMRMGNRIVLPQPLFQVTQGAKERSKELRSSMPRPS